MPELPEVETTARGIEPHLLGQQITALHVRQPKLRYPVPAELAAIVGQPIVAVRRRAKYILLDTPAGSAIVHLGMTGRLRVLPADTPLQLHDHLDLQLADDRQLRFYDPRRFGAWLWSEVPELHPLLASLGPEPLDEAFSGDYLHQRSMGRSQTVKAFIMDGKVVVGVGNIYACEALFRAGIRPQLAASDISRSRYRRLAECIKAVLGEAIAQGGTTFRDYVDANGNPGYFAVALAVYGREGEPCKSCGELIQRQVLAQRSTFFCRRCQR